MLTDLALVRLLQLASPALPIGLYSYSQGMERAVEDGWIRNRGQAGEWIGGLLAQSQARIDAPLLIRLHRAWMDGDDAALARWSKQLQSLRETAELRAEDRQGGQALARLLTGIEVSRAQPWIVRPDATLATSFSLAAANWDIPELETAIGYLWSWLENQVLCAVKLVPLGQADGQRLLTELGEGIPELAKRALELDDEEIGGNAFGLALSSSRHEVQYSRLFRS